MYGGSYKLSKRFPTLTLSGRTGKTCCGGGEGAQNPDLTRPGRSHTRHGTARNVPTGHGKVLPRQVIFHPTLASIKSYLIEIESNLIRFLPVLLLSCFLALDSGWMEVVCECGTEDPVRFTMWPEQLSGGAG